MHVLKGVYGGSLKIDAAFLLTAGAFLVTIVAFFYLELENASNKLPNGPVSKEAQL